MRENRFRWFGNMQQRPLRALVRNSYRIVVHGGRRTRGRTKRIWLEAIKKDIGTL